MCKIPENLLTDIEDNTIEVSVVVIYLGNPENEDLLSQIPSLKGFKVFMQAVQHYQKQKCTMDVAIEKAIDYTIKQNLLVELMLKEREGVKSMMMSQITQEEWDTHNFEQGLEQGRDIGRGECQEECIMAVLDILDNEQISLRFNVPEEKVEEIRKRNM